MMVIGLGYCLMGLWSMARVALMFILNFTYYKNMWEPYMVGLENDFQRNLSYGITIFFIGLLATIDAGLRVFVGLNARADAQGKKNKKAYIVWLIIFIVVDLLAMPLSFYQENSDQIATALMDYIGTFFMNIMTLVISVDLLVASLYVRKYRKLNEEGKLIEPETKAENEDNK